MKAILTALTALAGSIYISGCTTPIAVDPVNNQEELARYRGGYFYAPLNAPINQIFNTAIRELDSLGYFRTGELHKGNEITIYARRVGDEKITFRATQMAEGQSEIRIGIGRFGNLAESQKIYYQVRDALGGI